MFQVGVPLSAVVTAESDTMEIADRLHITKAAAADRQQNVVAMSEKLANNVSSEAGGPVPIVPMTRTSALLANILLDSVVQLGPGSGASTPRQVI